MKKSDITKEKILGAAEIEFAQKGLYGARVDAICERAGVNKRMIYEYFGNKETLYTIVFRMVYERLTQREETLLVQNISCVDIIKNMIEMYFDFLYYNPTFVKMVMWENLNEAKYIEASEANIIKNHAIKHLIKVLRAGQEQGIFKEDLDLEGVVLTLNMLSFSYFSNIYTMSHLFHIEFSHKNEVDKRCRQVTDLIMGYILK